MTVKPTVDTSTSSRGAYASCGFRCQPGGLLAPLSHRPKSRLLSRATGGAPAFRERPCSPRSSELDLPQSANAVTSYIPHPGKTGVSRQEACNVLPDAHPSISLPTAVWRLWCFGGSSRSPPDAAAIRARRDCLTSAPAACPPTWGPINGTCWDMRRHTCYIATLRQVCTSGSVRMVRFRHYRPQLSGMPSHDITWVPTKGPWSRPPGVTCSLSIGATAVCQRASGSLSTYQVRRRRLTTAISIPAL